MYAKAYNIKINPINEYQNSKISTKKCKSKNYLSPYNNSLKC